MRAVARMQHRAMSRPRPKRQNMPLNPRQAEAVKKIVKKGRELKFLDLDFNSTAITSTTAPSLITNIPIGDTSKTRDGNEITLSSLRLRYGLVGNGDATNLVRMIVFQWVPNNGSLVPANSDILHLATRPISTIEHEVRQQFRILYDRTHSIVFQSKGQIVRDDWVSLKKAEKTVRFNGAATSATNHLYLLTISNGTSTNEPLLQMSGRLFFTDA